MITTANSAWDKRLRFWRHHGMTVPAAWRFGARDVVFESSELLGYNNRMTDIQPTAGRVQLKRPPAIIERRRYLAGRYRTLVANVIGLGPPQEPEWARTNWQGYCVRLQDGPGQRDVIHAVLDAGLATRWGTTCAHPEPAYPRGTWACGPESRACDCSPGSCARLRPREVAQDRCVTLPLFPQMTEEEQDAVLRAFYGRCAPQSVRNRWGDRVDRCYQVVRYRSSARPAPPILPSGEGPRENRVAQRWNT